MSDREHIAYPVHEPASETGDEAESIRNARMAAEGFEPAGDGQYRKTAPARVPAADCLNWSVVVDYVPGQGWEACIEGEDGGGWEAQDVHTLLTYVASGLARTAGEQEYPPGTPMIISSRESYPAVVLTPPATVAGYRVLAWAETRRGDGEYPGGVVLCVSSPGRAGGPEYATWNAHTRDGGRTWHADAGFYAGKYETARNSFTKRALRRPAAD